MRANQRIRLRLAAEDLACAFGVWVLALVVALTPFALAVLLIRFAVQRWG